jgi:uncharacterized delta-60 repeat protein
LSQLKNVGESATFTVTAIGTPPLSYQWWKDGTALAQATGPVLALTNLQAADAGNYTVVVSNQYRCSTSAVAVLTLNLATADAFNSGSDDDVYALAVQADGKVIVGGRFTALAGQARNGIGRLNADGTLDTGFDPGADGEVHSLAVQTDGKILIGGWFSTLGGQARSGIARLNADGSLDTGFNPGTDGGVLCLAMQADGKILVGGEFNSLAGETRFCIGRLNADGTLDIGFNPEVGSGVPSVYSLAVQADGKILVGGEFNFLAGETRYYLGRLNADGTLDSAFNPEVGGSDCVYSLTLQADGMILVGGGFTTLDGQTRKGIGRLNADGTLDTTFDPEAGGIYPDVCSLAVQADGKILVGGSFTMLGRQSCSRIGRLNADGTLDSGFAPEPNNGVLCLEVQSDGKILVGGWFSTLAGQPRSCLGRLNTSEPATQNLVFDGSTLTWLRGGTSPEVWHTTFDYSTNGTEWINLGAGTRIMRGWQRAGISALPTSTIRARGFVTGGMYNGSGWFVETTTQLVAQIPPAILVNDGNFGFRSNWFGFTLAGLAGQSLVVEASTDLLNWTALATNLLGSGPLYFSDLDATNFPMRFYRARLEK